MNYSFDSNTFFSYISLLCSHTHTQIYIYIYIYILSLIRRIWIFWFLSIVITMDYSFECNPSFSYISLLCSHTCTYTHKYIGVLTSSFPMNKLCTQEERRFASWPCRIFPLPILLLFLTFWFLFNLNCLKNIEPAN